MNPWDVLGVAETASEEEIRAAYLQRVKEHPPDRSPEQFERVRDAYEMLRDRHQRARHLLFSVDPGAPLSSLVADRERQRRFLGPAPWRDVLNGK